MEHIKITSEKNPLLKKVRKLLKSSKYRHQEQVCVVEGLRSCLEVPEALIDTILLSSSFVVDKRVALLSQRYSTYIIEEKLFATVADTLQSQGIMMVAKMPPSISYTRLLSRGRRFLYLEDIQDPGNLGTIIRTAEAAELGGIFLSPNSVDVYNPKVVRGSMGSLFRVPFCQGISSEDIIKEAFLLQIGIFATSLMSSRDFRKVDYGSKSLVFMGNEGNGLSEATLGKIQDKIHIPMGGKIESLNLSIASSLIMYEMDRKK